MAEEFIAEDYCFSSAQQKQVDDLYAHLRSISLIHRTKHLPVKKINEQVEELRAFLNDANHSLDERVLACNQGIRIQEYNVPKASSEIRQELKDLQTKIVGEMKELFQEEKDVSLGKEYPLCDSVQAFINKLRHMDSWQEVYLMPIDPDAKRTYEIRRELDQVLNNIAHLLPQLALQTVFDLLTDKGQADYIGEPVTQYEHMLQAGAFAMENNYPDEVIVAALFHDIGHLFKDVPQMEGDLGTQNHEQVGADYLDSLGFDKKVTELVRRHVLAKRYLASKKQNYTLSQASRDTLKLQGGLLTVLEMHEFEKDTYFASSLLLRTCDEAAKVKGTNLNLDLFKEKCLMFVH